MSAHDGKERQLAGTTQNQRDLERIEQVRESLRALRNEIVGVPNPQITKDADILEGDSISPKNATNINSDFSGKLAPIASSAKTESAVAKGILEERKLKKAA